MEGISTAYCEEIERNGFTTVARVYTEGEAKAMAEAMAAAIASAFRASPDGRHRAIMGDESGVYAARNVLSLWPDAMRVWKRPLLEELLEGVLGPGYGLVRVLYFDKPPGNTWALPWHKDLTIAVRDHPVPYAEGLHPTVKAGIPHLEAPLEVLSGMLTARLHLDAVDDSNGPLKVLPGSHRDGKKLQLEGGVVKTLHAGVGDVLLIRPLVAHCSNRSEAGTTRHRRIVHFEFAATAELPGGLAWHDYVR